MIRFRKILCPLDFFPTSLRAFRYGLSLAATYKAHVHVLHAISPVITAPYGALPMAADMTLDLKKEAQKRLTQLQADAWKAKVHITTDVKIGDIDRHIRGAIATKRPDLVIMGTHNRRGVGRFFLGSVTERMIRRCPVPLLVVGNSGRLSEAFRFRRILVTTDFSQGTADALKTACDVAKQHDARVTLLHVVNDIAADVSGKYRGPLLKGVEAELKALLPKADAAEGYLNVQVEVGLPFRRIPTILARGRYDLLVMNIHGKTLVERALIGSTAERVVRAVSRNCPVLLIPPSSSKQKNVSSRK